MDIIEARRKEMALAYQRLVAYGVWRPSARGIKQHQAWQAAASAAAGENGEM